MKDYNNCVLFFLRFLLISIIVNGSIIVKIILLQDCSVGNVFRTRIFYSQRQHDREEHVQSLVWRNDVVCIIGRVRLVGRRKIERERGRLQNGRFSVRRTS